MAKGSIAKAEITERILNHFEGSFLYNDGKEIRIPFVENGETVQIKVTLTCAKVAVDVGSDVAVPGQKIEENVGKISEMTTAEKEEVNDLIKSLGL